METIALTGSRRMSAVHDTTTYVSMAKDEKSQMTERILNLTLEMVYLLTGEKYAAVKITCIEGLLQGMYPAMSERWGRSQNSIAVPAPHSPVLERKNMLKVQEITNKLMELLTGEVPIKCQDVTEGISISKDNKYLEGHKDLYKDIIIEDQPLLTSPDGSSNGNPPERCPRPLYSGDSAQEDQEILHHDQGIEQIKVEIKEEDEETYVMNGQPYKEEEVHAEIDSEEGNSKRSSIEHPALPPAWDTDEENSRDSLLVHPAFHKVDRSPNPSNPEEFSPNYSPSPSPNINQGLHGVAGSPAPSHSEEFYTNRSHVVTSNIYPGLDGADRSKDPSNPEGALLGKSDTVSNIKPGVLFPYRPSDPSKPEETSSDKSQTTSPNIIPSLLIGYRPPVPLNPEESSFSGMTQRAGSHEDTLYPCFSSLVKMVEHQKAHADQLGQKPAFGDHQKKHLGKKVFPCVECEKFFAHSSDLDKHQRRHSREKPFSCAECGKAYTQKSHLVNHQRLHTGENILPCTECGRCFTLKSQFIKHMRTHTGEKPYCCSECGRCFAQKSTLDNHQTIHTGQKPFSCLQCGKHFARKSTLQKHLELHASGVIAVKPCP